VDMENEGLQGYPTAGAAWLTGTAKAFRRLAAEELKLPTRISALRDTIWRDAAAFRPWACPA